MLFTDAASNIAGIAVFFVNMWSRIRPAGSQARVTVHRLDAIDDPLLSIDSRRTTGIKLRKSSRAKGFECIQTSSA